MVYDAWGWQIDAEVDVVDDVGCAGNTWIKEEK